MKTYLYEDTCSSTASKEKLWSVISDLEHWNGWDEMCDDVSVYGDVCEDASGLIKFKNGSSSKFEIIKLIENEKLILRFKKFLGSIEFLYLIVESDDMNYVTEIIEFKGLLGFFYSRFNGHKFTDKFQTNLKHLTDRAEKLNS